MNIHNLPLEILEKILVEGNFLSISRVCQTWRYHAQRKKSQFNEVFFDLTRDDPEKIEKKNPDVMYVFNMDQFYDYRYDKFIKLFEKISYVNKLNYIFDPLLVVKDQNYYISIYETFLFSYGSKIKILNILIKDVCDRIENIDSHIFFYTEIGYIFSLFSQFNHKIFDKYEKFTFKTPNNAYFIFDKNKKLLVFRFGNYDKYNFPLEKISICNDCIKEQKICLNSDHKQYFSNCFSTFKSEYIYNYYPVGLIELNYESIIEKVEKLIFISSEFHDFMFDNLLETSKNQKDKKIEYHCLNSNKTKFEQENFEFVPVEKEKEQEYSFEQIHFKYFGENAF